MGIYGFHLKLQIWTRLKKITQKKAQMWIWIWDVHQSVHVRQWITPFYKTTQMGHIFRLTSYYYFRNHLFLYSGFKRILNPKSIEEFWNLDHWVSKILHRMFFDHLTIHTLFVLIGACQLLVLDAGGNLRMVEAAIDSLETHFEKSFSVCFTNSTSTFNKKPKYYWQSWQHPPTPR